MRARDSGMLKNAAHLQRGSADVSALPAPRGKPGRDRGAATSCPDEPCGHRDHQRQLESLRARATSPRLSFDKVSNCRQLIDVKGSNQYRGLYASGALGFGVLLSVSVFGQTPESKAAFDVADVHVRPHSSNATPNDRRRASRQPDTTCETRRCSTSLPPPTA
jgi:hypothetical protein